MRIESSITKCRLCGCMLDVPPNEIARFLSYPDVDLVEWRLDAFIRAHSLDLTLDSFSYLSAASRHAVVATNRPTWEGGAFEGSEELRLEVLKKAVGAGAEWVDLEGCLEEDRLQWFKASRAKVLLSHHNFSGTPDSAGLRSEAEELAKKQPHAIKIVTYANEPSDNLRVLDLIPFCRNELGMDAIAFCMGPLGRWSRAACLLLGSPWTYVQLEQQESAAPGQFGAAEMRALLEMIS
jgi:3-dehydroquinate dehydratase-1